MGRYRTINVDLNRQYRNDLNANFAQIEQDIMKLENSNIQQQLMEELKRVERESKERDDLLVGESLEALIQSINDAKNNANTAASNADLKAVHAEDQGNYAKTQGEYASEQGDYAKSKGDYANEKAILADEAAGNANLETSNLSQLKVEVVEATQNANTATANANNATTFAQQQGDYAKQQADRARDVVDGTGLLTQTDIGLKVAGFNESGQVLDKNGNVVEGKVKSVNNVGPDGTGNISIPIPSKTSELTNDSGYLTNVPNASTAVTGIVRLNDSPTSTSTTQAATANAVKQVNDKVRVQFQSVAPTEQSPLLTGVITDLISDAVWDNVINSILGTSLTSGRLKASIKDYRKSIYEVQSMEIYLNPLALSTYEWIPIATAHRSYEYNVGWKRWYVTYNTFVGSGSPEGTAYGIKGNLYIDSTNNKIYRKATDAGTSGTNLGWVQIGG